jgi:D-galactose 1-dehydrogenase
MSDKIKLAIVGLGKIARDQHVPTLAASDAFELVAVASPHSKLDGVPSYETLEALLASHPDVTAVALCTTPQVRYDLAAQSLERGCHVLLEKPPGVTVSEVQALAEIARRKHVTLFASWHSRHAAAVEAARAWLAGRSLTRVLVTWKEDVRVWHPGQDWIWKAGGLGVFDPGINALSILTRILPGALFVRAAELSYPSNCETPIAAQLHLRDPRGTPITVELDFLQTGPQSWDIVIETTDAGSLTLGSGGTRMRVNDRDMAVPETPEYTNLYSHVANLVATRSIDADVAPLQLVADALLCGRHFEAAPFHG